MNKKLKLSQKCYALFLGLLMQMPVFGQVYCTGNTPFFSVDLTGNPSGTWTSPSVVRDGSCCGGGANQVNCIEMAITLDPSAVGINFSVVSGANPGGALYYQINCQNVPVPTSGAPICLSGPGPHYISYCKVGNNQNEYAITSVPGPYTSGDILTAEGCSEQLSVTGVDPNSISWNSLSPGTSGQYNNLLSNTAGTSSGTSGVPFNGYSDVLVTPTVGSPNTIQYEVCGNVVASCLTQPFCDTVSVTIVPELDVAISPATPYICYGQTFVTLTANPMGGLAPYTYNWSNGQNTPSINVTAGGNYSVTISDATGCPVATDQVTVVEFVNPITANAGPDLTVCQATAANVAVNGSVTGVSTGVWSGGNGTYTSSTTDLSLNYTLSAAEIAAGSVTLTLTTTNNGTCPPASDQVTITVSEMMATVASQQNLSCFGGANGSAIINATGGVQPYTYSLNGGSAQASNSFSSLAAGSYTVVVNDAAGCSGSVSFTITSPPQLTFTNTPQNVSCFGACDGQIAVNASGGTAPYTYSSNNGTTFGPSSTLVNLCAGTIGVVVQDANGCLTNTNVPITQPTQLTATYGLIDPICFGSCDGEIAVSPAGGTPAYQYSVDGGPLSGTATLTGLCAGNHSVLVQDANGCQITATQILVNPPTFGIDQISMSPSNCGFNDGAIEVAANGTNGPFTYSMDGGPAQSSGIFGNLVAGAYSFVATDALGCQAQVFLGVNDVQMDGILIDQGDVLCYGGSEGWVEVVNQAGADPITYELDNSGATQTNGTFNNLMAGSHIVTIYDAGLCVFTIPFNVSQPDEIQFTTQVTNVTCNGGNNGQINVNSTIGGTGAYQYSIDGITFQSGTTFSGLTAGTYDLYVMDANGCMVFGSATVTEPTPVAFDMNSVNLTCYENNTGAILLSGSGGTGSYQYSINNGTSFQTASSYFSLQAGTYNIVVQDAAGCQATGSVTLTQPAPLSANYATQAVSCFGSCDGQITVTANGGTAPYVYSSNNGVTLVTNPVLGGLCAGNYPVQVIDANGCGILSNVSIASPPQFTVGVIATTSTCDLPNGSLSATAAGGTPAYTYSIDNVTFGATPNFTGLAAGGYTIFAHDSHGCPASASGIVSSQPSPVISGVTSGNVSCTGVCDGTITINSTGGTGTIQYSIGGAYQTSNNFTGLCAGMYNLSVTDDNGCITNYGAQFEITEPTPLSFTTTHQNLTCFDNGTGVINFQAQGGTQPYTYSVDNGANFDNTPYELLLDAGSYGLVVQDANGCTSTGQVILTQPPLLEIINIAPTDALCADSCNGTALVQAQGGTTAAAYTYNWYTVPVSPNNAQITGLCAGSYTSVVLDDNGCYDTINFVINQPQPMVIDSLNASNPLCFGSCDGIVILWSSDAISYSFNGGATFGPSNTNNNLCEGNYTVIAQNANGCQASINSVILTNPPLLVATAGPDSILCLGGQGLLYASATGGTQPYTYYWDHQLGAQTEVVVPVGDSTYNVYVEDANGCVSNMDSMALNIYQILQTTVTADTTVCPGSPVSLILSVQSGVPNYNYVWYEEADILSENAQTVVQPDTTTTYVVYTTDFCTVNVDTVIVNTFVTPDLTFDVVADEGCSPMTVFAFSTVDPTLLGNNCVWTFSDGTVLNGCDTVSSVFTAPGCYAITLNAESADGCQFTGQADDVFCVIPVPEASFYHNPIEPTIFSSSLDFYNTSDYADTYSWTFSGFNGTSLENPTLNINGMEVGDTIVACLEAANYLGCSDEICQYIVIQDEFALYVPNAFTPTGDAVNEVFRPVFPPDYDIRNFEMLIFNRWGEVVFESHDQFVGWNGKYASRPSQDGVYTWKILVTDGRTNRRHSLVGHVSLLK